MMLMQLTVARGAESANPFEPMPCLALRRLLRIRLTPDVNLIGASLTRGKSLR